MTIHSDFLIVGGGIAGLRAAMALAGDGRVTLLTKADALEANTGYAQGGIAAAIAADDSPSAHAADTIAAGDGLCHEDAVRVLVEDGPQLVRELMDWGARFDVGPDGTLALAREGGHGTRRVLHARDATGREIARTLWRRVRAEPRIVVHQHATATRLVVESGRCLAVQVEHAHGEVATLSAGAVLLASGGAARAFSETTNPVVATGDGVAMAFDGGAAVTDLEFVQFHPTVLAVPGRPRFLMSEALRGEGARLVNEDGEAFMSRYDPAAELAPRDRVARAITREAERTGGDVYLTLAHLDPARVHDRFPLISNACREAGLDLAVDRLPVRPAAHYVMGGVRTDLDGRTSLPGLFAAGEVAWTGVHGANRLASNSLLEGLVFGARAARAMRRERRREEPRQPASVRGARSPSPEPVLAADEIEELRHLMWRHVGVTRDDTGLCRAVAHLEALSRRLGHDRSSSNRPHRITAAARPALSLVTVARLMASAARRRTESRGAHFRSDYPCRDDVHWARHVSDVRAEDSSA